MNKSSGATSRTLIILAAIIFVGIIVTVGVTRMITSRNQNPNPNPNPNEPPKPVYEVTLGDVKFSFLAAEDLGNILPSTSYEPQQTTTERYIRVTVGGQNKGKVNIAQYAWDLGNIVDSEGRNFVTINDKVFYHLPKPNLCGAVLKPEFTPTPCVKYYEVSKGSKDLKIQVKITSPKKQEGVMDLFVTQ